MIKSLLIQNYAIIDKQLIEFGDHLTIITGETGAGKSIIMGALELILGQRAQSDSLLNPEEKCIVEGVFDISSYDLKSFFEQVDLDFDEHVIVRREILPSGKSRAFVNDTPCNLSTLSALADRLIDFHHQFDTRAIGEETNQIEMLDALAGQKNELKTYQANFAKWKSLISELSTLKDGLKSASNRLDFVRFQFDELQALAPVSKEDEEIESRLRKEESGEKRKQVLIGLSVAILHNQSNPIADVIAQLLAEVGELRSIDEEMEEFYQRLNSCKIELEDLAKSAEQLAENIEFNEEAIADMNQRMDDLNKMMSKHHVQSTDELIEIMDELEKEISSIQGDDENVGKLEKEIAAIEAELTENANKLSKGRLAQAPKFQKKVAELLSFLSMPHARFEIEQQSAASFGSQGLDRISFLFSANPGMDIKKIKEVASGGELSRLALTLKSLVASAIPLPTLIFDEIDTGISGDVSDKMGRILEKISNSHQVICITHSPQIASKNGLHLNVTKAVTGGKTSTKVQVLDKDLRIHHLAVMLSSDPPSQSALENAKELILAGN